MMQTTRRITLGFSTAALIAGAATPVLALPGPDAELVALVARFKAISARLKASGMGIIHFTEDELAAEIGRWYEIVERATELSPVSKDGRFARATIAYGALASTAMSEGEALEREEQLALVTLQDLWETSHEHHPPSCYPRRLHCEFAGRAGNRSSPPEG